MTGQEGGTPPSQEDKGAGDGPRAPTVRELNPEEGGDPPARQRVLPAHGMPEWGGGEPPETGDRGQGTP